MERSAASGSLARHVALREVWSVQDTRLGLSYDSPTTPEWSLRNQAPLLEIAPGQGHFVRSYAGEHARRVHDLIERDAGAPHEREASTYR